MRGKSGNTDASLVLETVSMAREKNVLATFQEVATLALVLKGG